MKKTWYKLFGKELYSFKSKGDSKHKEIKSLQGVFVKDEADEASPKNSLPCFSLFFPEKRKVIYFANHAEKLKWLEAIKKAVGFSLFADFYDLGKVMGEGKFGVVKQAHHKKTG